MHAFLRATDRGWAIAALGVAGVEFLGWCFVVAAQPSLLMLVGTVAGLVFAVKRLVSL